MCTLQSHLDVLQVYFHQADLVRFRQQLDACDAGKLCEGGQDAQLVVDNLTHPVACPHQQSHHGLPVLELNGEVGQTGRGQKNVEEERNIISHITTNNIQISSLKTYCQITVTQLSAAGDI